MSLFDAEPVYQSVRGFSQESIAVEARSLGGFSGSPVFVYRSAGMSEPRWRPPGSDQLLHADADVVTTPTIESPLRLLGVNWGHMGSRAAITGEGLERNLNRAEQDLALNSGMLLLVPAWKLAELLDQPELTQMRSVADAAEKAKHPDSTHVSEARTEPDGRDAD